MKTGQSIVELLVAMGLAAILLPALATNLVTSTQGKAQQRQRLSAVALLQEGQEAVRSVRERNWSDFAQDGVFFVTTNGPIWELSSGTPPLIQNSFTRTVTISGVSRDNGSQMIVPAGSPDSSVDPSTKKVVVAVSWTTPIPAQVSSTAYLTRQQNATWTQTSYADFNTGSKSSVTVNFTTQNPPSPVPTIFPGDGEVELGAGGGTSDWCEPSLSLGTLDLDGQGVTTALSAIPGHAYATTGDNASGHALYTISITDPPPSPFPVPSPVASQGQFYDPTPSRKGYGLYATAQEIFVTTNKHTVNIVSATSLTEAGYFDNGKQGISVFANGTTGFVTTTQSDLISFDITTIKSDESQLNSVALGGIGQKVIVVGTHVYVVTNSTTDKFKIFDSTTLSQVNTDNSDLSVLNTNGQSGVDLFVNSSETYAYVVTKYSSTHPDFFIIDLSSKSEPEVVGTFTTQNGMVPNALTVVSGNRAIVVGSGGTDLYQVLNIQTPTSPTRCESSPLSFPPSITSINAISSVYEPDGDAFSYILTNNSSGEFQMIRGGPGSAVSTSGIFTSSTFDPCSLGSCNGSTFNWLSADVTQPLSGGNQVQLQVGVAAANSSNNCTGVTFVYVGPGGSTSTYFQSSTQGTSTVVGPIPFTGPIGYSNPGRCFSYRATLSTTDLTQQPTLYDVNINYSP